MLIYESLRRHCMFLQAFFCLILPLNPPESPSLYKVFFHSNCAVHTSFCNQRAIKFCSIVKLPAVDITYETSSQVRSDRTLPKHSRHPVRPSWPSSLADYTNQDESVWNSVLDAGRHTLQCLLRLQEFHQ